MTALPESGSFAKVDPTHVATVGPAAAILYARIAYRSSISGSWVATRRELEAETGLTQAMIRTAIGVLRTREWVTSERVSADDATQVWRPVLAGHSDIADSTPPPCEIRTTPPVDSAISFLKTDKENTPPTPQGDGVLLDLVPQQSPAPAAPDPLEGFDFWWDKYPRKTAKAAARKAWAKALKGGATPAAIVAGLRAQWAYLVDQNERGYCPHPTTWLNQERWTDEVEPDNVTPIRLGVPQANEEYDPEFARRLPPPRTDPYAVGGR